MNNQSVSVSKAKKAIADYKKAIGRPEGMAELSIFYCEEAFGFLKPCSMEDESYFSALIRMYGRSLEFVSSLPAAERVTYLERLDKLRSRGIHVGWGVRMNSIAFGTLPLWTSNRRGNRRSGVNLEAAGGLPVVERGQQPRWI
jgi:hypothetical protein